MEPQDADQCVTNSAVHPLWCRHWLVSKSWASHRSLVSEQSTEECGRHDPRNCRSVRGPAPCHVGRTQCYFSCDFSITVQLKLCIFQIFQLQLQFQLTANRFFSMSFSFKIFQFQLLISIIWNQFTAKITKSSTSLVKHIHHSDAPL